MPAGDSVEALKEIWMQGYREGYRQGLVSRAPATVVEISRADLLAVQHGNCGNPKCPVCGEGEKESR